MKLILVTGLDGSGKSTLLQRLEEISTGKSVAFIRVPKIDTELFKQNQIIYATTLFINQMHKDADILKKPQLKVIALFSSMLIFKELLKELNHSHIDLVFCERHPLIDTGVYAKFYAGKMDPESLPGETLANIEKQYPNEISYLLSLIGIKKSDNGNLFSFLHYIHDWFSVNKKHGLNDLKQLFKIDLPHKIIYLSAASEILMNRLNNRNVLEAHESKEVLEKLIPVYEQVLADSGVITEKIDANNFSNLDKAFDKLKHNYFLDTSL